MFILCQYGAASLVITTWLFEDLVALHQIQMDKGIYSADYEDAIFMMNNNSAETTKLLAGYVNQCMKRYGIVSRVI